MGYRTWTDLHLQFLKAAILFTEEDAKGDRIWSYDDIRRIARQILNGDVKEFDEWIKDTNIYIKF